MASITDHGNLGRPRSHQRNRLTVGVGPHTVRTPSVPVPVGPEPLQSFMVDSRLSSVADSERPGRTRMMTVDPYIAYIPEVLDP